MAKDIHRYSVSRFKTFQTCPRKHSYNYIEGIETEETSTTIPGKLFHKAVEEILGGNDPEPVYKEFESLCYSGVLDLDADLLESVVEEYFKYYHKSFREDESLFIEKEFKDTLENDDYLIMIVDEVYRDKNGYVVLRDRKTTLNKLKYTVDDVLYNQQLFTYLPYVEDYLSEKVDAVEIDEIRLAKLQPVPLLKSGKPSTNKSLLEFVTYEAYYSLLASMGLDKDKEFIPILEYLRGRGHPLFRRVRVQVLDDTTVAQNAQDMLDTYHASKQDFIYRVKGPLCNYCAFKELCILDYALPSTADRQMLIDKISKK